MKNQTNAAKEDDIHDLLDDKLSNRRRLLKQRRTSTDIVQPKPTVRTNKSNLSQGNNGFSSEEEADGIPIEKIVELLLGTTVLFFLVLDFFVSGYNSGEPLFISDAWDMVITTLYLRETLATGFNVRLEDFQIRIADSIETKQAKLLTITYAFISSYFFYCINTAATRALLFVQPSYLFTFWSNSEAVLKYFLIGFLPTYYFPKDFLFRMVFRNKNKTHELIGNATWTVSKLDSLKRTTLLFQQTFKFTPRTNFVILLPATLFCCQLGAGLKAIEINFAQNGGKIDPERRSREFLSLLTGVSTIAATLACLSLNIRFLISAHNGSPFAVLLFEITAFSFLFYRYSWDLLHKYTMSQLYEYNEAGIIVRKVLLRNVKVD